MNAEQIIINSTALYLMQSPLAKLLSIHFKVLWKVHLCSLLISRLYLIKCPIFVSRITIDISKLINSLTIHLLAQG